MTTSSGEPAADHSRTRPTTSASQRGVQSNGTVVVPGTFYAEGGRCTHPWLVVDRCSWCGRPHRHIVGNRETSYRRSPSCAPWRTYVVHITAVVPAAEDDDQAAVTA